MLKNSVILISLVITNYAYSAASQSRIIYGDDDRQDSANVHDLKIQQFSKAIAGRVFKYALSKNSDRETYAVDMVLPLSDPRAANVCSNENFANQPTISDCTGFLVSDRHLVTAGHCITEGITLKDEASRACQEFVWMFDYKTNAKGQFNAAKVAKDKIYGCKSVVFATLNKQKDYAIIELDRPVTDREPLRLSDAAPVEGTKLFIMGHPTGLPLKYAEGARVFSVNSEYFSTNLDSFGGNSGSPVFNYDTMEVEGILVRGDIDYIPVRQSNGRECMKVNRCDNNRMNCMANAPEIDGEHVTLISKIKEYIK